MIRGIVAIDQKRGMANEQGIPWDIPGDKKYFVDSLQTGLILMGYGTYLEVKKPFGSQDNYVATGRGEELRQGFIKVADARQFLTQATDNVWNIGGPGLLTQTIDLVDELYITQLQADFNCTKFLPEFHDQFILKSESNPITENNITYTYQIWNKILVRN